METPAERFLDALGASLRQIPVFTAPGEQLDRPLWTEHSVDSSTIFNPWAELDQTARKATHELLLQIGDVCGEASSLAHRARELYAHFAIALGKPDVAAGMYGLDGLTSLFGALGAERAGAGEVEEPGAEEEFGESAGAGLAKVLSLMPLLDGRAAARGEEVARSQSQEPGIETDDELAAEEVDALGLDGRALELLLAALDRAEVEAMKQSESAGADPPDGAEAVAAENVATVGDERVGAVADGDGSRRDEADEDDEAGAESRWHGWVVGTLLLAVVVAIGALWRAELPSSAGDEVAERSAVASAPGRNAVAGGGEARLENRSGAAERASGDEAGWGPGAQGPGYAGHDGLAAGNGDALWSWDPDAPGETTARVVGGDGTTGGPVDGMRDGTGEGAARSGAGYADELASQPARELAGVGREGLSARSDGSAGGAVPGGPESYRRAGESTSGSSTSSGAASHGSPGAIGATGHSPGVTVRSTLAERKPTELRPSTVEVPFGAKIAVESANSETFVISVQRRWKNDWRGFRVLVPQQQTQQIRFHDRSGSAILEVAVQ